MGGRVLTWPICSQTAGKKNGRPENGRFSSLSQRGKKRFYRKKNIYIYTFVVTGCQIVRSQAGGVVVFYHVPPHGRWAVFRADLFQPAGYLHVGKWIFCRLTVRPQSCGLIGVSRDGRPLRGMFGRCSSWFRRSELYCFSGALSGLRGLHCTARRGLQ